LLGEEKDPFKGGRGEAFGLPLVREGGGPCTPPGFGSFIGSTCPLSIAEYFILLAF